MQPWCRRGARGASDGLCRRGGDSARRMPASSRASTIAAPVRMRMESCVCATSSRGLNAWMPIDVGTRRWDGRSMNCAAATGERMPREWLDGRAAETSCGPSMQVMQRGCRQDACRRRWPSRREDGTGCPARAIGGGAPRWRAEARGLAATSSRCRARCRGVSEGGPMPARLSGSAAARPRSAYRPGRPVCRRRA